MYDAIIWTGYFDIDVQETTFDDFECYTWLLENRSEK